MFTAPQKTFASFSLNILLLLCNEEKGLHEKPQQYMSQLGRLPWSRCNMFLKIVVCGGTLSRRYYAQFESP